MTEEQPHREDEHADAGPLRPVGKIRMVTPPAGLAEDDTEGGDPVCWAHLVCDECGAITTEGHRPGCSAGSTG
jgi:hypothetical protein